MTTSIDHYLKELAGPSSWQNGRQAFEKGAVLDLRKSGKVFEARVANVHGRFERVTIRAKKNGFETRCSCPWKASLFCEHTVASLLQFEEEIPGVERRLAAMVPDYDRGPAEAAVQDGEKGGAVRPGRRDPEGGQSLRRMLTQASMRGRVEAYIHGRAPSLDSRWARLELRVDLVYDKRKYSASNIKRLVEIGSGAGGMRLTDFGLQEQQMMRFLLAHAEPVGTRYVLHSHNVADLFHCLTGFPSLHCGNGRLHIHPEHAELVLVTASNNNHYEISPRFQLLSHGLLPTKELKVIVGRGGSWIGVGADYWWLPGISDGSWMRGFLSGEVLSVAPDDLGRLSKACQERRIPARVVPDGDVVELHASLGRCRPVLTLDWRESGIIARLEFEYGGKRVDSSGPDVLWERKRFISRDTEAEASAVNTLKGIGFGRVPGKRDTFAIKDPEQLWTCVNNGFRDLGDEWQVYYSSRFSRNRAASGALDMAVRTATDETRWFELECELKTEAGQLLDIDKVLDALHSNSRLIRLETGALVEIPDSLRESLSLLLGRAEDRQSNRFRFGKSVAVPVNRAIGDFCSDREAAWQTVCKRLAEPVPEEELQIPGTLDAVLRNYQKEGVAWLAMLEECGFHGILADEMGLGKTIQALTAIARRKQNNATGAPSLVVCPTSLVENWLVEANRFAPAVKTVAIHGSERHETISEVSRFDLVVTSYALLRRDVKAYADVAFDYLILDEAQHIKNPDTVNARTCKALKSEHRLILTGTPVENALHEVWSLFDFLLPGMLGTRRQFREEYELPSANGHGQQTYAELAAQIRPFILRRTKREVCRELPPKMEQVVYCELHEGQRQLYNDIMAAGGELLRRAREDGWQTSRFEILSLLLRLRQVCCDPSLLPTELQPVGIGPLPSAKGDLLKEIMLQAMDSNSRMLIFSQFTGVLKTLRAWLDEQGIAYEYLDGSTKNRLERVKRFNADSGIPVFLISLKAGGTGLNLTGADTVIHYDQWWNPMVEDQATDRTHRIGQNKTVTSIKLVARHTVEEKILELQAEKRDLFNQLLGGAAGRLGELKPEDFEFLLSDSSSAETAVE
ncbi:MAG: DEAD/DEAH box helicase [Candidatus Pacebacteria bacterium]|nr:DEAD/DEAH box helicase [Candidatus Paceibacterota bacterium]